MLEQRDNIETKKAPGWFPLAVLPGELRPRSQGNTITVSHSIDLRQSRPPTDKNFCNQVQLGLIYEHKAGAQQMLTSQDDL